MAVIRNPILNQAEIELMVELKKMRTDAINEWERLEGLFKHRFQITHEDEGGETPWDDYVKMKDWLTTNVQPGNWTETGDHIGFSSYFWLSEDDDATLFKLSFSFA